MQTKLEQIRNKFSEDIAAPIHVCDLGSCQYASVQAVYEFALAYLQLDRAAFEEELGITYTKTRTKEEFLEVLRLTLEEFNKEEEDEEYHVNTQITSIEEFYETCRNQAFDLWSATVNPLENFEMESHTLTGFQQTGFILNDLITANGSFGTGVDLAYTTFLYGTPMSAFADFDT